jgi:hypothetical protein
MKKVKAEIVGVGSRVQKKQEEPDVIVCRVKNWMILRSNLKHVVSCDDYVLINTGDVIDCCVQEKALLEMIHFARRTSLDTSPDD